MKYTIVYALLAILSIPTACLSQQPLVKDAFSHAAQQSRTMLQELEKREEMSREELVVPRTLSASGELELVASKDWTSGFFSGVLWYLYQYSQDTFWLEHAREYTVAIEQEKENARTHDMGFKIYCSFGNGYRLTNDAHYREVILEAAKTLSTRFHPKVGAIRSWDHNTDKWDYPVIIDNMMNLELLFAATRLTGDSTFYNIAVSHADVTLRNHFREDHSTYHVIGYDPETGEVSKKNTHQGYSHESAWARGQAWGLYGYTMCYRESGQESYLQQAEKIARYMLEHPNMPKDLVPYWDYDAPEIPDEPRDASAAAVMASALYELSTYSEEGEWFREAADKALQSLREKYTSKPGENKGFILLHSTGSKPHNSEIDVPLIYSDYYYLEALLRKQKLDEGNKLF